MTEPKSFDLDFFPPQINYWHDTAETLHDHWRKLDRLPRLPELNPKLDDRLLALIPALNDAKRNLCANIHMGAEACHAFAGALTESAKSYGMAEDEAEALARDWGHDD